MLTKDLGRGWGKPQEEVGWQRRREGNFLSWRCFAILDIVHQPGPSWTLLTTDQHFMLTFPEKVK